jgi:hypothetical protein
MVLIGHVYLRSTVLVSIHGDRAPFVMVQILPEGR